MYFICYFQPFWLVPDSGLMIITDFTLSKLRYMIFTESQLLSFSSYSSGQGLLSSWTLHTNLPLFGHLWPCCCLSIGTAYCFEVIGLTATATCLPCLLLMVQHLLCVLRESAFCAHINIWLLVTSLISLSPISPSHIWCLCHLTCG